VEFIHLCPRAQSRPFLFLLTETYSRVRVACTCDRTACENQKFPTGCCVYTEAGEGSRILELLTFIMVFLLEFSQVS